VVRKENILMDQDTAKAIFVVSGVIAVGTGLIVSHFTSDYNLVCGVSLLTLVFVSIFMSFLESK
jgi:hypothetical protein